MRNLLKRVIRRSNNWIYRQLVRLEVYGHEVDAHLASLGGNYEFAADCVNRKAQALNELHIAEVNHG